jgi:hypothetical protein
VYDKRKRQCSAAVLRLSRRSHQQRPIYGKSPKRPLTRGSQAKAKASKYSGFNTTRDVGPEPSGCGTWLDFGLCAI